MAFSGFDQQNSQLDKRFYVQDVDFPSGFISAQMPVIMAYVAALRGFVPPDPEGSFSYCELGCSVV